MIKTLNFPNKLLCLDFNSKFILIGDNKGFLYKINIKDNFQNTTKIEKLFSCDSPISNVKIFHTDIYYTTWDGVVYKNDNSKLVHSGIIKSMIIHNNLIYISVDLFVFVLDLDLNITRKIDVPHKVLCFCSVEKYVFCGLNLPNLIILDNKEILKNVNLNHDTAILAIRLIKNDIFTGSVDGSIQVYDKNNITSHKKTLVEKSKKWIRAIFDEKLYSRGNEVIYDGKIIFEHQDEVMDAIKLKDYIFSIGLDCRLNIYMEETVLDQELEEIELLNKMF